MLPLIQETITDIYQSVSQFIIANMVAEFTLLAMFVLAMVTLQHLATVREDKNFKPANNTTYLLIKHHELKMKNKGN